VLVNSAGSAIVGALEETSVDQAKRRFDTNVFGVMLTSQAVLRGRKPPRRAAGQAPPEHRSGRWALTARFSPSTI
jgi:NAD(P)-dependent dehydrogenase (short-subunit alcohol dehydrogenase family)